MIRRAEDLGSILEYLVPRWIYSTHRPGIEPGTEGTAHRLGSEQRSHADMGDQSSRMESTDQMVLKLMKDMHLDKLPKLVKKGLKKAHTSSRKKSMLDKATFPVQSVRIVWTRIFRMLLA